MTKRERERPGSWLLELVREEGGREGREAWSLERTERLLGSNCCPLSTLRDREDAAERP